MGKSDAYIHQVRNAFFAWVASLVGGNRSANLCGCVDPLMLVSQVPMERGTSQTSIGQSIGERPSPPRGQVNTHIIGVE